MCKLSPGFEPARSWYNESCLFRRCVGLLAESCPEAHLPRVLPSACWGLVEPVHSSTPSSGSGGPGDARTSFMALSTLGACLPCQQSHKLVCPARLWLVLCPKPCAQYPCLCHVVPDCPVAVSWRWFDVSEHVCVPSEPREEWLALAAGFQGVTGELGTWLEPGRHLGLQCWVSGMRGSSMAFITWGW